MRESNKKTGHKKPMSDKRVEKMSEDTPRVQGKRSTNTSRSRR